MLQHATGHHADRALFHKRFEDFPQCHRHPCPSFTGSLLLARGIKLPKNSSTLEGLVLAPYQTDLTGVVVESTYNWYWLVDGLMEADYRVHLANPAAMQQ